MDLNKLSMKKIRELIIFTVLLVVALWKFEVVIDVLKTIGGILFPFCTWWSNRFRDQCANEFFGKEDFWQGKRRE